MHWFRETVSPSNAYDINGHVFALRVIINIGILASPFALPAGYIVI